MDIDFDDMTLGELEAIEEMSGVVMSAVGTTPPAKVLTAAACVVMRRTLPEFSLEEARAIKVRALNLGQSDEEGGEPDPTNSPAGIGDA